MRFRQCNCSNRRHSHAVNVCTFLSEVLNVQPTTSNLRDEDRREGDYYFFSCPCFTSTETPNGWKSWGISRSAGSGSQRLTFVTVIVTAPVRGSLCLISILMRR